MQLFFDLDGTLADGGPGIRASIAHALRALGRVPPSEAALDRCVGPPLQESFAELLGTRDEAAIAEAVALYRERYATKGLFENELFPGIPELLEALLGLGHVARLVTSKPIVYATRIVEHFGLASRLAGVHGSELSGRHADKASLIGHVLDSQRLRGETCVMIGDRSYDVDGARARGLRCVGVLWGYGSAEELAGADALVGTPAELLRVVVDWADSELARRMREGSSRGAGDAVGEGGTW